MPGRRWGDGPALFGERVFLISHAGSYVWAVLTGAVLGRGETMRFGAPARALLAVAMVVVAFLAPPLTQVPITDAFVATIGCGPDEVPLQFNGLLVSTWPSVIGVVIIICLARLASTRSVARSG